MSVVVEVERFSHPLLPEPVNRYRVELGGETVYIDAGLDAPRDGGVVVVTHHHWDHTLGLARARGLRVCMDPGTRRLIDPEAAMESVRIVLEAAGYGSLAELARPYTVQYGEIRDALDLHEVYSLSDCPAPVEAVPCPGHSGDHHCILVSGAVFLGDNYVPYTSSTTLTSPREYMDSMLRILGMEWSTAYPGHGEPGSRRDFVLWLSRVLERKMARIAQAASLVRGVVGLDRLLHAMYPGAEGATLFLAARNLVGYVRALEELDVVRVDRGSSPWLVEPL